MTRGTRRSREDVVRAAVRLFAERGYRGTSMRELGQELGLLGSSLYSHVGGKEELLVEVIERGAETFQAMADRVARSEAPPEEQLRELVSGHVRIITGDPHQAAVFLNEARWLGPEHRRRVLEMRDRYEHRFREVLRRGVEAGRFRSDLDVPLAAIFILSALNAITRWYRPDGRKRPAELARDLYEFVLRGIGS